MLTKQRLLWLLLIRHTSVHIHMKIVPAYYLRSDEKNRTHGRDDDRRLIWIERKSKMYRHQFTSFFFVERMGHTSPRFYIDVLVPNTTRPPHMQRSYRQTGSRKRDAEYTATA